LVYECEYRSSRKEQKEKGEQRWDGMNEKENSGTSLVVQWLGLPMRGVQILSLTR